MSGREKLKRKWLVFAVTGLLLIGAGISIIGEAIILKLQAADFWRWFSLGTVGLVAFNAGLSIFGQAVVFKSKLDS